MAGFSFCRQLSYYMKLNRELVGSRAGLTKAFPISLSSAELRNEKVVPSAEISRAYVTHKCCHQGHGVEKGRSKKQDKEGRKEGMDGWMDGRMSEVVEEGGKERKRKGRKKGTRQEDRKERKKGRKK